ncbi:TadE/TadG family type IV pilus assembly protein [Spirillospora sp. CA-253888]
MPHRRPTGPVRRARGGDRGAASVEAALTLPVILLLVFAIIDFGRMFNAQITLTQGAREGARAAAFGGSAQTRVAAAVGGLAPVTTTVTACPAVPAPDDDVLVRVSHPFQFVTPVAALAAPFGGGRDRPVTLTAQGVMPCPG